MFKHVKIIIKLLLNHQQFNNLINKKIFQKKLIKRKTN
jgi:hypothetical protein